jgi:hypothetical protein
MAHSSQASDLRNSAGTSQSVHTPSPACCQGPLFGGPVLLWCSQGHSVYAADARRDYQSPAAGGAL